MTQEQVDALTLAMPGRAAPAYQLHRHHDGRVAARAIKNMPGMFTSDMGGAQTLIYTLTDKGVAARNMILGRSSAENNRLTP